MLRIYFLQQWYGLADEALEDTLGMWNHNALICSPTERSLLGIIAQRPKKA